MTSSPIEKAETTVAVLEEITMPSLGADMTEGTLTEWLVKKGDRVTNGDIIAVLETQKGAIDMEVYSSGTISEILVQPVTEVPVGTVLARIALAESSQKHSVSRPVSTPALTPIPAVITDATPSESTTDIDKSIVVSERAKETNINASPIVRRLAKEQQLDLTSIKGSGPQGAILLKDLTALLKSKTKTKLYIKNDNHKPADNTAQNMRNAIAVAMAKSKQEIPHFYLSLALDITNAQQWLQQQNQTRSPETHVLLLALLLKALAKSLPKYPKLNGFYQHVFDKDSTFEKKSALGTKSVFEQAGAINIGNVISLRQGGLVVPAIHNVDKLSVNEVMQSLRDITERSRNGHLRSSELTDATITVTNMGERGVDSVFGIIYPPQVAIIGFGKVRKVAKVVNDNVVIAQELTVSLSADHRVIDGMLAAKFLNYLAKKLQKPERL